MSAVKKRIIALLTDFGLNDWFVPSMKGVIKSIAPAAEIIDITHNVPSYHIASAGFVLLNVYRNFPPDTIFCCVTDPGVGGERRPLISVSEDYVFIGPDNGTFDNVILESKEWKNFLISPAKLLDVISVGTQIGATFHGRDIFAPAAALIVKNGLKNTLRQIAAPCKSEYKCVQLPSPSVARYIDGSGKIIRGQVCYIDKFGNLITNIKADFLLSYLDTPKNKNEAAIDIEVCGKHITKLSNTYCDANEGEPLAYIGSADFLEIAVNYGNAAELLHVKIDDEVKIKIVYPD